MRLFSNKLPRCPRPVATVACVAQFFFLSIADAADNIGPLPSSALDQAMLSDCDALARPYGDYQQEVWSAIDALDRLGVFAPEEFRNVRIGICDLRSQNGPVATTSCERNTILLDEKYENDASQFSLVSTLAHEMKHVLQHAVKKEQYGDVYCSSDQYVRDKDALERDADAFSVAVEKIAFLGRPVEIENTCPSAVEVYVDGESVRFEEPDSYQIVSVKPNTTISANATSTSKSIQYYAATTLSDGLRRYWRGGGEERIIDGVRHQLAPVDLETSARASGSFVLRVHCD